MRFDSLAGWLHWLESHHPRAIDLGLDRISQVADKLALSFRDTRVVTIAGTNGKGSCVATLNALLRASGYHVGCYTSPHFLRFNERIVVDDKMVDDDALVAAFARIDAARGDVSLTYFEFSTLAALLIFMERRLDVLLLEVGLGGRLDAVNIIDADIAVVTGIDIDHVDWLGDNREQIGAEKAGIFRAARAAICGDRQPPQSLLSVARQLDARLYCHGVEFGGRIDRDGATFDWYGRDSKGQLLELHGLPLPALPMDSVLSAIQAAQLLPTPLPVGAYDALAGLQLTGRMQSFIYEGRKIIADVAHNAQAVTALAERLAASPCQGKTLAVCAIMADKDADTMVQVMSPLVHSWFVGDLPNNSRAMPAAAFSQVLAQQAVTAVACEESIAQAIHAALEAMTEDDRLIVFGSFYTVAELMAMVSAASATKQEERNKQ